MAFCPAPLLGSPEARGMPFTSQLVVSELVPYRVRAEGLGLKAEKEVIKAMLV